MDTDIYFVTFADKKYAKQLERIRQEAVDFGIFKEIYAWNEDDLDGEWMSKHYDFIGRNRRGYGYWIWKPQVIYQALMKIPKGSVVVYADAGCKLNRKGSRMLMDLCQVAKTQSSAGIVALQMRYIESEWTKMDLMNRLGYTDYQSHQVQAGISVWANVDNAVSFVREWGAMCCEEGYRFVDDSPSHVSNVPTFHEHRHDQSIFSILMKMRKGRLFPVWPNREEYPIWPLRLTKRKG